MLFISHKYQRVGEGVQMANLIFELAYEKTWVGILYGCPSMYKVWGYEHIIPNFGYIVLQCKEVRRELHGPLLISKTQMKMASMPNPYGNIDATFHVHWMFFLIGFEMESLHCTSPILAPLGKVTKVAWYRKVGCMLNSPSPPSDHVATQTYCVHVSCPLEWMIPLPNKQIL